MCGRTRTRCGNSELFCGQHYKGCQRGFISLYQPECPTFNVQGNIRGLLGSLHTVLWEGSGWVPVNMGDLLEGNQVCKSLAVSLYATR